MKVLGWGGSSFWKPRNMVGLCGDSEGPSEGFAVIIISNFLIALGSKTFLAVPRMCLPVIYGQEVGMDHPIFTLAVSASTGRSFYPFVALAYQKSLNPKPETLSPKP